MVSTRHQIHLPRLSCDADYGAVRLAREDGAQELAEAGVERRDMEVEARSLWNAVNGKPGDILYAGEFDGY